MAMYKYCRKCGRTKLVSHWGGSYESLTGATDAALGTMPLSGILALMAARRKVEIDDDFAKAMAHYVEGKLNRQ